MDAKEQLIQRLDEARAKMRAAIADIDREMEIYPGWTVKHVLAHIAGWDDAVAASLLAHLRDTEPPPPVIRDIELVRGIDYYNAKSVETREMLPYERVVQEWEAAREQVKAILREMPAEKFDAEIPFPWARVGTVVRLLGIFIHHETQHAAEIEQIRAG